MTPKAKQIMDKVKADAVKIGRDPEFQKIKEEMKESLRKTGRIDPDLVAKAFGARRVTSPAPLTRLVALGTIKKLKPR